MGGPRPPEDRPPNSLVSCAGSLVIVDLPLPAQQLEFPDAADEPADVEGAEEMVLF